MKQQRLYYGWFDNRSRTYRVSKYPPDAPSRPSAEYQSAEEATTAAKRKRWQIMWIPPLTSAQRPQAPL